MMRRLGRKLLAALLILVLMGVPPVRGYASDTVTEEPVEEETSGEESAGESENAGSGVAGAPAVNISAPSALLMEASTGTVILERNADAVCSPASITKIMTLLLIFEALDRGDIKLEDEVMTSAHAQSMGGSQVFLE